ncbi:MAG: acylneuraminate cytidylyltransferase family protein [Saprospiraceae bacterium]
MKILALIPARGGSKGVPLKNRKLLGGQPLIAYSINAALACEGIERVTVSTDDEDIASISKSAGAKVPFLRPAELATDKSPSIDTVIHALQFYKAKNINFEAICLLQPTCPFRTADDIAKAIKIFKNSEADCLISVRAVPHQFNPHWTFEEKENSPYLKIATGEKNIISRRQDLPKVYYRDGSIYLTKTEIVLEQRSLYGEKISWFESENKYHVNIDTLEDWAEAEEMIKAK